MKKRGILALAAAALVLLLAACAAFGAPTARPAPAETPGAEESAAAPQEEQAAPKSGEAALHFSTTAFDGSSVDESILAEATVTMVNFFEPWCPPCIAELPELQKLYENYADKGFNLIGVYSTEEGTTAVLADAGVGYPVLRYTEAFDVFQTGYVPTTVFLDASGNQLGESVIAARSYEQWEEIVKGLLG